MSYVRHASFQQHSPGGKGNRKTLHRLDMELTERCNLNCVHCYINQPANDQDLQKREMKIDQIRDILQQAADLGCMTVRFTGGEPLLRPDFPEIYLAARRLGLRVLLFTNATLLRAKIIDLLRQYPPLERIEITIYGMSEKSYQAITGKKNAYEAAMQAIKSLCLAEIPFIVKGALLPANQQERAAFEQWADTLPWMDRLPAYSMFFDQRARRDNPEKQQQIQQLRNSAAAGLRVLKGDKKLYLDEMGEFCSRFTGVPGAKLFTCGAGLGCSVDSYGWYQPCLTLRHPDTVWDSSRVSLATVHGEIFAKMRKTRATNPEYLARCARCSLKGLCEQCPAKSWMEHGTLDTPVEYLCQLAHEQAVDAGFLPAGAKGWTHPVQPLRT